MFYSTAARPLIPVESSLLAGISAYPNKQYILYWDAKDGRQSVSKVQYLSRTYVRDFHNETNSYWRWVAGNGDVIYTDIPPSKSCNVYDSNYRITDYKLDKVTYESTEFDFPSFERALVFWQSTVTKNKWASSLLRTTKIQQDKLSDNAVDPTQVQKLKDFYIIRMKGRFLAKETGTYTIGCSFGYGSMAMQFNGEDIVKSTTSRESVDTHLYTVFLRQGSYPFQCFYRHMENTQYPGYFVLRVKRPGETSYSDLTLSDLTSTGL
jgi:hypothetical protein